MNKVKIGVIGIGAMGSCHAMSIFKRNIRGLELAAVCDTDSRKLDWAHEHLPGVETFDSSGAMLASGLLDAVLIATPHYSHPDIATAALRHGLHTLTEKPAGVYTAQVEVMNEAAAQSGKVFCIMYNQRTHPLFIKARELVHSGTLGALKRSVWIITNWYRTQRYYNNDGWRATWAGEGGGVLLNQCPHNLDVWQWIVGMPSKVRGFLSFGKYHNIEVEDEATIYTEYDSGATGLFITTTGELPGTNRLEISGELGKLVIEDGKLKHWKLATSERELCFTSEAPFPKVEPEYSEVALEDHGNGHNTILQNFANAILHGEALISPGIEGIRGLTLSNAAHLSAWTDDWAPLPLDQELFYKLLTDRARTSELKPSAEKPAADSHGSYSARWSVTW